MGGRACTPAPTEVDRLIAAGDEPSLRRAVELEPGQRAGRSGLGPLPGRTRSPSRTREEALALLARLPETAETRHLAAQARLGASRALAATGCRRTDGVEAKLDALLDQVRDDDAARQEFVDLLEVLGSG